MGKAISSLYTKRSMHGHTIRLIRSFSFILFFFVCACVWGVFFPLFRGRYAYIFPLTYHEGAIQTIYMPHCHVEIYFIELLYRYPCRILKRYINRRYSHFFTVFCPI